ncbi:translocation/assembly module TamB domain-containing protein [Fortiea contorta]|uniref:translocation/assembly module TamB domain-containing protein n=1 Tax=Fortiea contorta TaxID=1892405 RepID=UPI00034B263A|nr:translocation/assembly module TamB [Fortiea contorta]
MIESPNQDKRSNPPLYKRLWLLLFSRGGLVLGGVLLLGGFLGVWRLWTFVQKDLAPLAQKNLTSTLNRPVTLGKVTDFSLTGVRFGASAIPATATDPDRVAIESVEVGFDPSQLIFNRRLKLDVTLVNPEIYLEKDDQGRWVSTTIAPAGKDGPIKTDLDKLRLRNAKLVLVPQPEVGENQQVKSPPSAVAFSQLNGTAELRDNNQLVRFDVGGRADNSGGNVAVRGEAVLKTQAANLQIRGQDLLAADITSLIKLPLNLPTGRVNGDLQVQLIPQQQPLLYGNASLQGATLQIPLAPQLLTNTQGNLGFQGMEIKLENVATNYGKIPVVAQGIIDRNTGFKLAGRVNGVSVPAALETLKVSLPVPTTGEVKADLQIVGPIAKPTLSGSVTTIKTAQIDKVDFKSVSSKFELSTSNSLITFKDIQGTPTVGGEVVGGGTIKLDKSAQLNFNVRANNVPGDAIAQIYNPTSTIRVGTVSAQGQIAGAPGDIQTVVQWQAPGALYPAKGTVAIAPDRSLTFRDVALNVAGGVVRGSGTYTNQGWQAVAQAAGVQLAPFVDKNKLQNVSLAGAEFNGRLLLSGTTAPFKLANIRTEGAAVQIAGGTVGVSNLQLQDQSFAAQLVANDVRLGRILSKSPAILNQPLSGTFQIAGNRDNFSLKTLRGTGEGRLAIGNGRITASNIQLVDGRYRAQVQASNVPLGQLAAVPPQFRGALAGNFDVAGSAESFQPETIQATGAARLNVAGGAIAASNIQLANGRYQAVVDASGVQLNRLNPQLRGAFAGKLQVAGNVASAKLADVRAAGQVQFSQGIAAIEQPLTAAIAWNGEKLIVERATGNNLNASGEIAVNAQQAGVPQITGLNLNVQAQGYSLQQLPIKLPNNIKIAGKADFDGQISGQLPVPNIQGQLRLRDLTVKDFAFEPVLSGNIQAVQGKGVNLNLAGNSDRLVVNLDANNRPQSFLAKWQQATAVGQAQGDNLAMSLKNFPIKVLNLTLPANTRLGSGALAGDLTGNLQVNQKTFAAAGELAIAQPEIGRIKGDRLAAQFRYRDGVVTLANSEFIKNQSRYAFTGEARLFAQQPQLQGKLSVTQGQIQDVLTTLQIFELRDTQQGLTAPTYGRAADLTTNPQGLANESSLLTQVERFYQIDTLITAQEQQRRESNPVPELVDLQGTFNGEVALNTATPEGLAVNFKLNGQNWRWGKEQEKNEPGRFYQANQVIAEGSFSKGVLQLLPLRIETPTSLIAFQGNVGSGEQNGNLQVVNFPIEALNNFVKLPVYVTGNVNGKAALAGSIDNPRAKGELQITDGTINRKKLESANASFSYDNRRLNFSSQVTAAGPEPVNITGSVAIGTETANKEPINLDIKVKNEGLALLNLLTNQVAFEEGEGEVDLKVQGTLEKPLLVGTASVNNATFAAQALPGKLREVTGKVQFNKNRISVVEKLAGKFSRGKVEVAGEIPIFNDENEEENINIPLTVNLEQLALNLKGLYQGGAGGNLQITGSALNPIIGGQVNLFDGQVLLAESTNTNQTANDNLNLSFLKADKQNKADVSSAVGRFNDLKLVLDKNVQITRPPILSFVATGGLTVNGSFTNPIPEGEIRLTKGGVNLFTTQFNLASGYTHTATFRPSQPRDPDLHIRLFAKVLDGIQTNDINRLNTTGLAGLETIRVEATIQGLASKLNENLELKSSPARGETEIIALLGGGFVGTQGRGDSTLGLINIAGSAVFNNFQGAFNQIGDAFGLSELRLFPTVISEKPEAGRSNSSLELAVEAGVDISNKFSVSGIKILTTNDPFQWGINYRINDKFRVRASTNLDDDSRAVIEYENRF